MIIKLNCDYCGKEIIRSKPSLVSERNFCSRECLAKGKRPKPRRGEYSKCMSCGKEIYLHPNQIGKKKCCSRHCYALYEKTNTPLNCSYCGKEFYISKSQQAKRKNPTCSTFCQRLLQRKLAKEKRELYGVTNGIINRNIRYSADVEEWRIKVFERDNYSCRICGARSTKLNAHHIFQFAYFPDIRFDINNGATLCKAHHDRMFHYRTHAEKHIPISKHNLETIQKYYLHFVLWLYTGNHFDLDQMDFEKKVRKFLSHTEYYKQMFKKEIEGWNQYQLFY